MNIKNSFKHRIIALALLSTLIVFSRCKKDSLEETQIDAPQSEVLADSEGLSDSTALTDSTTIADSTGVTENSVIPGDLKSTGLAADGITSSSYYLIKSLPSGYVKDGSKDYTSYVQSAISKYSNIVFPAFPILVNSNGIRIASNKVITFPAGSQVRLKGTSTSTYNIFNISGASNITLYNPVIIGDRSTHSGSGGEAGVGIGIRTSSNITLVNPQVSNCWGDGIYIGQASGSGYCKNIVIKGGTLKKNRRDGISIIAVDGLLIDNLYAGYSDGTLPMAGINFEPNSSSCQINNVRVNNPRTERNGASGIQISNKLLVGSSNKTSNITITNHTDIGSPRYAFKLMANPTSSGKLYGLVSIVNPTWSKTGTGTPLYVSTNQSNYKTKVSSPSYTSTSGSTLSYSSLYSLLMKQGGNLTVTN
jgi:hypothetical protein